MATAGFEIPNQVKINPGDFLRRAAAAVVVATLVTVGVLVWLQMRTYMTSNDFVPTYMASRDIRLGSPADMYNLSAQAQQQNAIASPTHPGTLPYLNPPAFALASLPLSYFDVNTATLIWSLGQIAMFVAAAALLVTNRSPVDWRKQIFGVIWAVSAVSVSVDISYGQSTGVVALGLALAYRYWSAEKPQNAAIALGVTAALVKPHLLIALAVFAIARNRGPAIRGLLIGGGLATGVSMALLGPQIYVDFVHALVTYQSNRPGSLSVGIPSLMNALFGSTTLTLVLSLVLGAGVLVAAWRLGSLSRGSGLLWGVLGATCLTLILPSHVMPYDVSLLAPLIAVAVARGGRISLVWSLLWLAGSMATDLEMRGLFGWIPMLHVVLITLAVFAGVSWVQLRRTAASGEVQVSAA
jgi:hypothetical protein